VDLILGQGRLRAGWDAHNLNAPGKFLVSAPGHDRPKRVRAYLLTDQAVTEPPHAMSATAGAGCRIAACDPFRGRPAPAIVGQRTSGSQFTGTRGCAGSNA
jgi:hypothetical protein